MLNIPVFIDMGNVQGGDRSSFHGKRDHSTGGGSYLQSPPGNAFWQPEDDPSYGNTMNANYLTTDSGGLQIRLSCDDYSSGQRTANIVKFDEMLEFPVVLKYTGNAKAVCVTGSWDGWRKKIPMVRSANDFTTIINLPEGRMSHLPSGRGQLILDLLWASNGCSGDSYFLTYLQLGGLEGRPNLDEPYTQISEPPDL
uniref:5'-AMP-activated protein kinase subunit beta-1 n=1 Tax=Romanomermis culicivorax TaxID=13658 RepID=A0A915JFU8_ROMCU